MRFLYRQPRLESIREELDTVIDVMSSEFFIYLDLFWYSLILALFLSTIVHSFILTILIFFSSYVFFISLYLLFFKRPPRKN